MIVQHYLSCIFFLVVIFEYASAYFIIVAQRWFTYAPEIKKKKERGVE